MRETPELDAALDAAYAKLYQAFPAWIAARIIELEIGAHGAGGVRRAENLRKAFGKPPAPRSWLARYGNRHIAAEALSNGEVDMAYGAWLAESSDHVDLRGTDTPRYMRASSDVRLSEVERAERAFDRGDLQHAAWALQRAGYDVEADEVLSGRDVFAPIL